MILVCCSFRPWKFEYMAADLLALQLRDDHPLPPDGVLYFTQSLTHDSINIRKVGLSLLHERLTGSFSSSVCFHSRPPGGDLSHGGNIEATETTHKESGPQAGRYQ